MKRQWWQHWNLPLSAEDPGDGSGVHVLILGGLGLSDFGWWA